MKRTLILSAAIAVALAPLWFAAPAAKADGLGLFKRNNSGYTASRAKKKTRPQVRGFVFQPGGFSYRAPDIYSYDYMARPPSDFGPYLDYGLSPTGTISNDLYH